MVDAKDKKRIQGAAAKRGYSVEFDGDELEFKKKPGFDDKPNKEKVKPDPVLALVKEISETNKALLERVDDRKPEAARELIEVRAKVERDEKTKLIDTFILTPIYKQSLS